MAYIAVDKSGRESIFSRKPRRVYSWGSTKVGVWTDERFTPSIWRQETRITIPRGSVEKLIGKKLTWDDEPVKL